MNCRNSCVSDLCPAPAATNNAPLRTWAAQLKQVVERRNLTAYGHRPVGAVIPEERMGEVEVFPM